MSLVERISNLFAKNNDMSKDSKSKNQVIGINLSYDKYVTYNSEPFFYISLFNFLYSDQIKASLNILDLSVIF